MALDNALVLRIITDIEDMASDLKRLGVRMDQFTDKAEKQIDSLGTKFAKFGLAIQGIQHGIQMVSGTVERFINPSARLQEAMLGVQKTTGLTNAELKTLESRLVGLSIQTGQPAEDLALIAEQAGQLGIKGVANLDAFTRTVSKMIKTTDLSVEEAGSRLAQLANLYDQPITEVEKLGDVINELSNNTSAGARDIVESVRRMGTEGKALGFAFGDMAGIAATLKEMGIDAERGGTGVRNVMMRLQTQSKAIARDMGISQKEWEKMISEDGKSALLAYLDVLNKMDQVSRTGSVAKVFGMEGAPAIKGLAADVDMLRHNMAMANDQFERGGSLNSEFNNMMQGMTAQASRFAQGLKAILIGWGNVALPYLTEAFRWLADNVHRSGEAMMWVWNILRPFTYAVISYVAVEKTWIAIQKLKVLWTQRATIAQKGLNFVMKMNPIGLLISALALAVGAFQSFSGNMGKLKAGFLFLFATVKDFGRNFTAIMNIVWVGGTSIFRGLYYVIREFAQRFKDIFGSIGDMAKGFWKIITGDFEAGWEMMKSGTAKLATSLGDGFKSGLENLANDYQDAWDQMNWSESEQAWHEFGMMSWFKVKEGLEEASAANPPDIQMPSMDGGDGGNPIPEPELGPWGQKLDEMGIRVQNFSTSARDAFVSLGSSAMTVGGMIQKGLDQASKAFLDYLWRNYIAKKLIRGKEQVEDAAATASSVVNSATRTTANTVEAGTGVLSSVSSIPFPLNIALMVGGIALLFKLISGIKGKAKKVPAMATGGATMGPQLVLAGEGSDPVELFAPQKDFLTYAKETLTPKILGQVRGNTHQPSLMEGVKERLDTLIGLVKTESRTVVRGRDIHLIQNKMSRGKF